MKDLSIIIVTYNSENYIKECLLSIFETIRDLDFEVIVVDNNSKDKTTDVVKRFPKVRLILNSENLGFTRANNQGIKQSQGQYILLLNPDTKATQGAINNLYSFLKSQPKAGVVGCQLRYPSGKIQPIGQFPTLTATFFYQTYLGKIFPFGILIYPNIFTKVRFKKIQPQDWLPGACLMIKKEVFDKVGHLDPNYFMFWEDMDFCYRAKEAGFLTYYYPKCHIIHFSGVSLLMNQSRVIHASAESLVYFFKKFRPRDVKKLKKLIILRCYIQILRWLLVSLVIPRRKILISIYKELISEIR